MSITAAVHKYNGLVRTLKTLVAAGKAPPNAVVPREIKLEGLFKLDVDHDIWQDLGFEESEGQELPRWLADEKVREGIRCRLELDRCVEEQTRLQWETCALQEWFMMEWETLQHAKSTSE